MRPTLLLTNDDGSRAAGLQAFKDALQPMANLAVAAPRRQQSGVGRHISLWTPLRAAEYQPNHWAVDGTPTDCVYLALGHFLTQKPDFVISGINLGPNLGEDVWYSGTVNAALEAASFGVRSVAFSQELAPDLNWQEVANRAVKVLSDLIEDWPDTAECISVNLPATPRSEGADWRWAPLGRRSYKRVVEKRKDLRGSDYFWIGGPPSKDEEAPGTDSDLLSKGWITATPIARNATDWLTLKRCINLSPPF